MCGWYRIETKVTTSTVSKFEITLHILVFYVWNPEFKHVIVSHSVVSLQFGYLNVHPATGRLTSVERSFLSNSTLSKC